MASVAELQLQLVAYPAVNILLINGYFLGSLAYISLLLPTVSDILTVPC